MKKTSPLITVCFLFLLLLTGCSDKPNLSGYTPYRTFDEYSLKGIGKLTHVKNRTDYVSIKNFGDSIKVYSHSAEKMFTYVKKDRYWLSKKTEPLYPHSKNEDLSTRKYIFNDTIVIQRDAKYLSGDIKNGGITFRTHINELSFGINRTGVLSYSIIQEILHQLRDNTFEHGKYYVEDTSVGSYLNKEIRGDKLYFYRPTNDMSFKNLSLLLKNEKKQENNHQLGRLWSVGQLDSICEWW